MLGGNDPFRRRKLALSAAFSRAALMRSLSSASFAIMNDAKSHLDPQAA
jgi:hypothetical protein